MGICRECPHAFTGKSQHDRAMEKLGYKSCNLARTPVERALYVRGSQKCMWPGRVRA